MVYGMHEEDERESGGFRTKGGGGGCGMVVKSY